MDPGAASASLINGGSVSFRSRWILPILSPASSRILPRFHFSRLMVPSVCRTVSTAGCSVPDGGVTGTGLLCTGAAGAVAAVGDCAAQIRPGEQIRVKLSNLFAKRIRCLFPRSQPVGAAAPLHLKPESHVLDGYPMTPLPFQNQRHSPKAMT